MKTQDLSTTCYIPSIDTRWASKIVDCEATEQKLLAALVVHYRSATIVAEEVTDRLKGNAMMLGRSKAFRALSAGQVRCLATASALEATVNGNGVALVAATLAA